MGAVTNIVTATWNWWLFGTLLVLVTMAATGAALVPGGSRTAGAPAPDDASADHGGGPNTLPPGTAVFAGRDSEMARLLTAEPPAAAARPLVCLVTGRSGSGKTELAVQAAHLLADRYPGGCLFVGYRSHAESAGRLRPQDVLAAVLAIVGAAPATTDFDLENMSSQWRSAVGNGRFLIVLDDVSEAAQVRCLLPASARSMVIVTSRHMVPGLDADLHVEVDALSEDAARSVVGDILRRASRPVDRGVIDALVAVHRLPLTIRHIADRIVAEQTPLALRAEPNLTPRAEGGEPLLATIEALAPVDHLVFRRTAVHPGPHVTAEIAAALAGLPVTEAARALALLHRHGLVIRPDPHGYGFHDLVRSLAHREYSRQDDAATRDQTRERLFRLVAEQLTVAGRGIHASFVIDVRRTGGQEPRASMAEGEALDWLRNHFDDLRSVARLAIDCGWPHSWQLTAGLAYFMRIQRNIPQATELNDSALQLALVSGDEAGRAHCSGELGALHRASGRYRTALVVAEEARGIFHGLGDSRNEAYCASEVGMNLYHLADYAAARDMMADAAGFFHRYASEWRGEANALGVLGMINRATGDYQDARNNLNRAMRIYRANGNHRNMAWILIELGTIDRLTGAYDSAEVRFTEALRIKSAASDRNGCAWARRELGIVRRIRGHRTEAQALLDAALQEFTVLDGQRNMADVNVELCTLHREAGELDTARDHGDRALRTYERLESPRGAAWTEVELGVVDREEGDLDSATARFEHAGGIYARIGDRSGAARVLLERGRLALLQGEPRTAMQCLEDALVSYTELGAAQAAEVRNLLAR
ncbi:tetratricopeptide repeat protein [Streptomyces sp. GbtcB6]|uniref:tetratricopeptide repeat protein n=1 Tax=Streptomyces sp. GbtcB6 TaxID=2824751 RepID=UPI001C30BD51|nr:tetratricopeptide repeat protein [Streptomyces sp. GbtcB6]